MNAHYCLCEHTMVDHKITRYWKVGNTQKQKHGGACEWAECPCTKFELGKIKSNNRAKELNLPTLIDCNYSIHAKKGQAKKPKSKYLLQEADRKGKAQNLNGYHPQVYDNGEYP